MISPFSTEEYTTFIIFKPGYASVNEINLENIFSEKNVKEMELPWCYNKKLIFKFAQGVVGLPKLKTWEERSDANAISPTDDKSMWPTLQDMIEKEDAWLRSNQGWRM